MEREKQELGCDQVSCLSEIGGALGATRIVNGFLSRFGGTYLLTLRMVDVRHEQILKEGSERIDTQNEDGLLDAVTRAVHQLFPDSPLPPRLGESARPKLATQGDIWEQEEAAAQPTHSHALGISLVVAGVASAGVAVYGFVGPVAGYQNDVSGVNQALAAKTQPAVSPGKLQGELGTAQTWEIVVFHPDRGRARHRHRGHLHMVIRRAGLGLLCLLAGAAGCLTPVPSYCLSDADCDGGVCVEFACTTVKDGGGDAGVHRDAGFDAGVGDAGLDGGTDAGTDAGLDAGADAGLDAGVDAGPDAGLDAGCQPLLDPAGGIQPRAGFAIAAAVRTSGWRAASTVAATRSADIESWRRRAIRSSPPLTPAWAW